MKTIIMVIFFRTTCGQGLKQHGKKLPTGYVHLCPRQPDTVFQNLKISLLSAHSAKEKLIPRNGLRTSDSPGRKHLPATSV
jgi:hypothetical protein